MTDAGPWEQRFLDALIRVAPEVPPRQAFLYRRTMIARVTPGGQGAPLIAAAAELLAEEGFAPACVMGCLRAVLAQEPTLLSADWFWNAGRGDLMPLVQARPEAVRSSRVAKITLPLVAALAATAVACGL